MLNIRGPLRVLILMIVVGVCACFFAKQMFDVFYVLPQGGEARERVIAQPIRMLMQRNPLWVFDPSMVVMLVGCFIIAAFSFGNGRRAYVLAAVPLTLFLVFMGWSTFYYTTAGFFSEEQATPVNMASESMGGVVTMLQMRTGLLGLTFVCLTIAAMSIPRLPYSARIGGSP